MGVKITGLDKVHKEPDHMEHALRELESASKIPMNELFTESFMLKHTSFSSFDELLDASGFDVQTNEDFDALPQAEFDAFISRISDFPDWEEMIGTATEEYCLRKLDF